MEHAAEALKMAAAVLLFVLALGISITSFGEARKTTQMILNYRDREYDYQFIDNETTTTQRVVSGESIIPSIYKAYKENYKIVFKGLNKPLYQKANVNSINTKSQDIYTIDLEKDIIGSDEEKERFIRCLLYRDKYVEEVKKFENSGIFLNQGNFYDIIKGKQFKESLGIYYQEELQGQSNTPDANRTKKRVITYEVI